MLKEVLVIDKSYSINLEGQAKNLKIVVMRLDFAYRNSQRRKKELRSFDDFLLRSSSSCCCCSPLTLSKKSLQRSRRTEDFRPVLQKLDGPGYSSPRVIGQCCMQGSKILRWPIWSALLLRTKVLGNTLLENKKMSRFCWKIAIIQNWMFTTFWIEFEFSCQKKLFYNFDNFCSFWARKFNYEEIISKVFFFLSWLLFLFIYYFFHCIKTIHTMNIIKEM